MLIAEKTRVKGPLEEIAAVLATVLSAARAEAGVVLLCLKGGDNAAIEVSTTGAARVVDARYVSLDAPVMIAHGTAEGLRALLDGTFDRAVGRGDLSVRARRSFLTKLLEPKRASAVDVRCLG